MGTILVNLMVDEGQEESFTPATSRLVIFFLIPSIIGLYRGHLRLPALAEVLSIQVSTTTAGAIVALVAAIAVYAMHSMHARLTKPKVLKEENGEKDKRSKEDGEKNPSTAAAAESDSSALAPSGAPAAAKTRAAAVPRIAAPPPLSSLEKAVLLVHCGTNAYVYFRTMFPTISGGDSGELAGVACTGGVAHPPGYPLWLMLARGTMALLGHKQSPFKVSPKVRLRTPLSVCVCVCSLPPTPPPHHHPTTDPPPSHC